MYHSLTIKDIYQKFKTRKTGLTEQEAQQRLQKCGYNEIKLKEKISIVKIFLEQFKSLFVLLLMVAALVYFLVGHFSEHPNIVEPILIVIIVILNAVIGFFQDYKAEKSIQALKKMISPTALVIRNNIKKEVDAKFLVPGDIISLKEGDIVPADSRIIEENALKTDESALTGESTGVEKETKLFDINTPLAERKNMVFSNTHVLRGTSIAIVTATGISTEIGKIASQIYESEKPPTVFEKEISTLSKKIAIAIVSIIIFIAVTQSLLLKSIPLIQIFITSIALAVAAIPEGLPIIVTLTLALGTQVMVKRNALVRNLPVIENLGSVDVICTDKTGTLTENKMEIRQLYLDNKFIDVKDSSFYDNKKKVNLKSSLLLEAGFLCNNASRGKSRLGNYIGDPTEIAILRVAEKANISSNYERIKEIPFSSERKMMTVICKSKNKKISFTKGAPEIIIKKCSKIYENGRIKLLTKKKKEQILNSNSKMAKNALRVLAFSFNYNIKSPEKNMIFLGLQGMIDPPRKGVKKSIAVCKRAGIRVIMITGDNKETAIAIAKELNLNISTITGQELDKMSVADLRKKVEEIGIFARVTPSHKVKILKALQENKHIVAMTGDGINDAPALKNSDVGISMNIRGTEVAKEASDMILLDDNFSTIQEAIKQGRTIFKNIRNFVTYLLTSNFAEVFVIFLASLFGYLPITAAQLLWLNLLTDGFPALALGSDPSRLHTMKEKPRKNEAIINKKVTYFILSIGSVTTVILLCIFFLLKKDILIARTTLFTGFVLFELIKIAVIRHQDKLSFFSNKWLLLTILVSILLQLLVIYTPLSKVFKTTSLGFFPWLILIAGLALAWILAMFISRVIIKINNS